MARIITKGLIGAQDLNVGTGTFTRATSVGGTNTMSQVNLSTLSQFVPTLFANLPSPAAEGMVAAVTDSTVSTFGSVITGGGGNNVLAFYNGTNWVVV